MLCDALGFPIKLSITAGQVSDFNLAEELLKNEKATYVIADKGYDSENVRKKVRGCGAVPVIPYRSNRKNSASFDRVLYKERNIIERLFNKLKQFRKIATRFEKNLKNFEALVYLASSILWLQ